MAAHDEVDFPDPGTIRFAPAKLPAPVGEYIAKVVHVEPNWTYLGNRKVALYFEVIEGRHKGTTARKFYRLERNGDDWYIGNRSNLAKDARRLFPDACTQWGINPATTFMGKVFNITVEHKTSKKGDINAMATDIQPFNPGF